MNVLMTDALSCTRYYYLLWCAAAFCYWLELLSSAHLVSQVREICAGPGLSNTAPLRGPAGAHMECHARRHRPVPAAAEEVVAVELNVLMFFRRQFQSSR